MKIHVIRTCIISKKKQNPKKMIRINATNLGKVAIDYNYKLEGRGAYLILKREYVVLAQKKKLLEKRLKTPVSEEIYQILLKMIPPK